MRPRRPDGASSRRLMRGSRLSILRSAVPRHTSNCSAIRLRSSSATAPSPVKIILPVGVIRPPFLHHDRRPISGDTSVYHQQSALAAADLLLVSRLSPGDHRILATRAFPRKSPFLPDQPEFLYHGE